MNVEWVVVYYVVYVEFDVDDVVVGKFEFD